MLEMSSDIENIFLVNILAPASLPRTDICPMWCFLWDNTCLRCSLWYDTCQGDILPGMVTVSDFSVV